MKIHRFHVAEEVLIPGAQDIRDASLLHQWKDVLRLKPGDQVALFDGQGRQARATVRAFGPSAVSVEVTDVEETDREGRDVVLYAALLKRENVELVLQKATEIGVSRIVPIVSARTVKLGFKRDRAEKIVREAAEQCGRSDIPAIDEPTTFSDAVAAARGRQAFLHTTDASKPLAAIDAVDGLWIGPEGGWADDEVLAARSAGFDITSLGALTLRAETAAIVASYLAIHS